MPTLTVQVQTTLDGYMAGPQGEMDWMTFPWSDDVGAYIGDLMAPVDHILLGRHLAEGFIPHWAAGPEGEPQEAIDFMNDTPKTVMSRTLTTSPWPGTEVASDLLDAVAALKARNGGGDVIGYGGATLVASLLADGLVDDLHVFVNPTAIGAGLPVFPAGADTRMQTVAATRFACGITALHLQPA